MIRARMNHPCVIATVIVGTISLSTPAVAFDGNDCILAAARTLAAIPGAKIIKSTAGPVVLVHSKVGTHDFSNYTAEAGISYEAAGISGRMFFRCTLIGSEIFLVRVAAPRTISPNF